MQVCDETNSKYVYTWKLTRRQFLTDVSFKAQAKLSVTLAAKTALSSLKNLLDMKN